MVGAAMSESDSAGHVHAAGPARGVLDRGGQPDIQPGGSSRLRRRGRRPTVAQRGRTAVVTLLGAVGATLIGLAFVASFIGALHNLGL
jgi:hypothetical protein